MYQVNKLFLQQNLVRQVFRSLHHCNPMKVLYPLTSRCLLKISGNDVPMFLQGLITNDMHHFEEGAKTMYAMFLNNKGRVLFDTLIHRWEGNDSFLLECDRNVKSLIEKHLKTYKLKRNVEVSDTSADFRIFALINATEKETEVHTTINPQNKLNIYKDPRLADLGYRLITPTKVYMHHVEQHLGGEIITAESDDGYKYLRYKLGVSEGADELPPGSCFPLEANCDYLHGVSFHKGCYIGQELTARIHHTGVVRKRIMPLKFLENTGEEIERHTEITADDQKKSKVGKLKDYINDYGIGLIRIKEALEAKSLKCGTYTVEAVKPSWWPIEAPKEKIASKLE